MFTEYDNKRKKLYGFALLVTFIAVVVMSCIQIMWFLDGEFDLEYLAYRLMAMVGVLSIVSLVIALAYGR